MVGVIFVAALLGSTYANVAAVVVVLAVLAAAWKLIGRGAEGIVLFNKKIVPNVQYMDLLPKVEAILTILEEVVAQVRTDHGSSLLDTTLRLEETTGRLEGYAEENREAAAQAQRAATEARDAAAAAAAAAQVNAEGVADLKVLLGTAKERATDADALARGDRDLARDALEEIKKLIASAARTEESGARIEAASAVVADDLAADRRRADDVTSSEPPSTAADAASQSPNDGE